MITVGECVRMTHNLAKLGLLEDVPTEDEAEQTKSSNATKGTGRRLKREGAFILDKVEGIPGPQAGNFLEKIKSKHAKPGSGQKDHDRKKHGNGSPDTDAVTSSKAKGRAPNKCSKKRSRSFTESEKSQSELPESPVKARYHKEKAALEKAQKEIDELKKQLKEKVRDAFVDIQYSLCDKKPFRNVLVTSLIPSE